MSRPILIFYLLMLFVSSLNARDFQRKDDHGIFIHKNCQSDDCSTKRLKSTMALSEDVLERTQQEVVEMILAQNLRKVATTAGSVIAESKSWHNWVAVCFKSPADLIEPEKADSFVPISPRPLTTEEQNNVSRMLRAMEGNWEGYIDEEICYGTDKTPRIEKRHYAVDSKVKLNIDDILLMKSEILNIDGGTTQTQSNSLQLKKNWIHFSDVFTSDLDSSRWDVEIISIDADSFVFMRKYRQPGRGATSTQQLELKAFQVSRKSILIKEWFYVQGTFARMRTWTLK